MLKIDKLNIYAHNGRPLLKDLSFVLNDGDKVALIGEEGNGKSTLLKIIAGIDVSDYVTYDGQISCDGIIGYLPQHIDEMDLEKSVSTFIAEDTDYNHLYGLLSDLRIDDSLIHDRHMHELSGGEKVKISLLKVLYGQPDILLLDEPTNDLDLETLIWLEEFIKNSRLSMIFISHDETLLENCAEGILHLEQLKRKTTPRITYSGVGYRQYISERYSYIERNNMIARKERSEYDRQLQRWRRIYQRVHHDINNVSRADPHTGQLLKKKMHAVKAQGRRLEEQKKELREKYEPEEAINIFFSDISINPNKEILDIDLKELKAGDMLLSRDVKMKVRGKDKVCIIGKNGCGKTTLIKEFYRMLKEREDIRLGYMPQDYREVMDYEKTPVHYLWDGMNVDRKKEIQNFLGALKFTADEISHRIADLSEGQKCKILIMKMIVDRCDVLLLDEPTRNLSPLSNPELRKILIEYGGCIISVSHDRRYIEEVADTVYELDENGLRMLL